MAMVTKEDVVNCYRYIMGREPENEKVIEDALQASGGDFVKLRQRFLTSQEFKSKNKVQPQVFDFSSAPMDIEQCSPEQRQELFTYTQKTWKKMGEADPYWSVLTADKYHLSKIDEARIKEFYDTGTREAKAASCCFVRNGLVAEEKELANKNILEFGCGVGRVTQAFAGIFNGVTAVDISAGNMNVARKVCPSNVNFILIKTMDQYERLPKVDAVYSKIVLQHNCPPRNGLFAGMPILSAA